MEIQHLTEEHSAVGTAHQQTGFWKRQFGSTNTRPQLVFDVVFGVIGPILCFAFDPIVFRNGFAGPPLLPRYQAFVYLFSGLQIVLLCLWLFTGPGLQVWNRMIGGTLLAGGLFCLTVGVMLAPFSLIGLIYVIGVFGFTPFLTALSYLRNSVRALRAGERDASALTQPVAVSAGILLAVGLPLLLSIQIHSAINRALTEILKGDSAHAIFAAHRLMPLRFFAGPELDQIVNAYRAESNAQRKELLKSCYREITGDDIENRVVIMDD